MENWEEEFDNKFPVDHLKRGESGYRLDYMKNIHDNTWNVQDARPEIKEFIKSKKSEWESAAEERGKMLGRIEGVRWAQENPKEKSPKGK